MIGERGIIHNAGDSDATLRLLHDDRISASWRPSPPEDTSGAFKVVLHAFEAPPEPSAAYVLAFHRKSSAFPGQTTRGNGRGGGSIMRASEESPAFHFHPILAAFIIRTLPDSGRSP